MSSVKVVDKWVTQCFFSSASSNIHTVCFIHPQTSHREKYDIEPKRKNKKTAKYTSALREGQCHVTACCIYMYTTIKCQVPEAVNNKE